jgi:putative sterol carrier protein
LDEDTYARLSAGDLDPQDAFLSGQVEVSGDEGMAIGLALAALSPE